MLTALTCKTKKNINKKLTSYGKTVGGILFLFTDKDPKQRNGYSLVITYVNTNYKTFIFVL